MIRVYRPATVPRPGLLEVYGGIGLLLLLTARFVPLARWVPGWGCALREHTGIPCLSCGMTRSFDWFMRGRLLDSLAINPLGFLLALLAATGAVYLIGRRLRLPRVELQVSERAGNWIRVVVLLVLAANWGYLIARALLRS